MPFIYRFLCKHCGNVNERAADDFKTKTRGAGRDWDGGYDCGYISCSTSPCEHCGLPPIPGSGCVSLEKMVEMGIMYRYVSVTKGPA